MPAAHHHDPDPRMFDDDFWDERYAASERVWSGNPNPQLVAQVADLTPGRALDVGSGEGADAIWLATQGWRVTAVDFSRVALDRGAARAAQAGPEIAGRIEWLRQDVTQWSPEKRSFDLVSAQFMHLPKEQLVALFQRLAEAVAPGGTLLVVGHHFSDLETSIQRPAEPGLYFVGADVAASLPGDGWDVVANAVVPRTVTDPDGNQVTIHDAVFRAARS